MSQNNAWDKVEKARSKERPSAKLYISSIFDDFIELHGDRYYGDDKAIISGIALLNNSPVTIVAQCKGENTKENIERNFSMPHPEGYRKALRLMKQAEKFNRPIILFVDTPGAFCGVEAEKRGQGEAIGENLFHMSDLTVPTITVVIGEGGSGGALALAVSDEVWMMENSIYSILSPEGFASILWKDKNRVKEAAEIMKITAHDLKGFNIIDYVVEENSSLEITMSNLKSDLIETLNKYMSLTKEEILEKRYFKYRNMGNYIEL